MMDANIFDGLKMHHAESFGWALACTSWRRSEAEDLLQEAYLKVLDGRAIFEGRSSPKTWFFSVIKMTAFEIARKQSRRSTLDSVYSAEPANDLKTPDVIFERSDETRQLLGALAQLPVRQREVLHLVFYCDLTLEETADALEISVGAVRTHYHRGKQTLADYLRLEMELNDVCG